MLQVFDIADPKTLFRAFATCVAFPVFVYYVSPRVLSSSPPSSLAASSHQPTQIRPEAWRENPLQAIAGMCWLG
jgi:hypothetical protein